MSPKVVWDVVEPQPRRPAAGAARPAPHVRATASTWRERNSNRSDVFSAMSQYKLRNGREQKPRCVVNDRIGIEPDALHCPRSSGPDAGPAALGGYTRPTATIA